MQNANKSRRKDAESHLKKRIMQKNNYAQFQIMHKILHLHNCIILEYLILIINFPGDLGQPVSPDVPSLYS